MRSRLNRAPAGDTLTRGIVVNALLKKTYFLLSLTLIFSALTAYISVLHNDQMSVITLLVGMFGLYFLTVALRNSPWGLLAIFAYTGFMGYSLGPVLNMYLHTFVNGPQLIATALGLSAVIFLALSAYTVIGKKDFSFMGGFLMVGILVAVLASFAGMFFHTPVFQLVISGVFALLMSAYIMYLTSSIMYGGETNYIMATISLYIALFNLFISLLQILGAFGGNRN